MKWKFIFDVLALGIFIIALALFVSAVVSWMFNNPYNSRIVLATIILGWAIQRVISMWINRE